jgi:MinD-like ATPase involved in chromosome partitioning or flagellar assembly
VNSDVNRVIWCTPGNPHETDLISGVTQRGFTVVRRCLEAVDVLAAASIEPHAAVVLDADTPRLSADTVAAIPKLRERIVIALAPDQDAAVQVRNWGIHSVVMLSDPDVLDRITSELSATRAALAEHASTANQRATTGDGSDVTVVYGAAGAPGRSTIALGLSEAWSRSGDRVCLIDADSIGPSLALLVGMTEDVSGVLVAARYADQGALDVRSLSSACRRLDDRLWLMTGIGSADRWHQLRPASFERVVSLCAEHFDRVVIDTNPLLNVEGFDDALTAGMPGRDGVTRSALHMSDSVVVVTQPDAVSVVRLSVDVPMVMRLIEHSRVSVAVNRASKRDGRAGTHVAEVLTESGINVPVHTVPEDGAVSTCRRNGSLLWEVAATKKLRRSLSKLGNSLAA